MKPAKPRSSLFRAIGRLWPSHAISLQGPSEAHLNPERQTIIANPYFSQIRAACLALGLTFSLSYADPVHVVHKQGSMHGFILLKTDEGKVIATGDQINVVRSGLVSSRLVFRFHDGSIDDEITTFRQGPVFQLLTDHHVQKGPSFPDPLDVEIDTRSGQVTSRSEKNGQPEIKREHMNLPPDLANGLVSAVLESFPLHAEEMKLSYLASAPKPRVVTLTVKPDGTDTYRVGGAKRSAHRFNIHVDLRGLTGVIAPILGKQPDDLTVWVTDGPVPAFIKLRGALYQKGPLWTMELTSPEWSSGR